MSALILGAAAGVGAVLWLEDEPKPDAHVPHEHAVELVLLGQSASRVTQTAEPPIRGVVAVDAAVLLSGAVTSTVTDIKNLDRRLAVRAEGLPLTVSPADRFQLVDLEVKVRDCTAASNDESLDLPFTIAWRDEYGREHTDSAGDMNGAIRRELTGFIDQACADR
ncbi:hypothetical protein MU582_02870 [Nocardioidaceae bacterium SCSIO 66511]|nr:hypothetical protein MU582_02870 [Nocardioidaceae bacterium SCSIO 66511]